MPARRRCPLYVLLATAFALVTDADRQVVDTAFPGAGPDCEDTPSGASSKCCRAQRTWAELEASGGCSSLNSKGDECAVAEALCKECYQDLGNAGTNTSLSGSSLDEDGANEGVAFASLDPADLSMRCVPPKAAKQCSLQDIGISIVFLAGLLLLVILVSSVILFDHGALPYMLPVLAAYWTAQRPQAAQQPQAELQPTAPPSPPPLAPQAPSPPRQLCTVTDLTGAEDSPRPYPPVVVAAPPPLDDPPVWAAFGSPSPAGVCGDDLLCLRSEIGLRGSLRQAASAGDAKSFAPVSAPGGIALGIACTTQAPTYAPDRRRCSGRWPARLAQIWAFRAIFLHVALFGVCLRLVHIVFSGVVAPHRRLFTVVMEVLACALPLFWCFWTSRPPSDPSVGIPHSIGYSCPCQKVPRFVFFAITTLALELFSTTASAWAVTSASCDTPPWLSVSLYCFGIPVAVIRSYSALLALRVQDRFTHARKRVLPASKEEKAPPPLAFTDIECSLEALEGEFMKAPTSGGAVTSRLRSPTMAAAVSRSPTGPVMSDHLWPPDLFSGDGSKVTTVSQVPARRGGGCSCWRRLRNRAHARTLLFIGVVLLLLAAVASILALHNKEGKEDEKLPSACVTAQNSTATCEHFEFVGEHLWDSSVSNFVSGSVDVLEDCCSGCDSLPECQAWIFESIGRRCRWLRFLESPCQENPGDLRCRCLTHYGTTFGFKPTSQIVWVKREQGRV